MAPSLGNRAYKAKKAKQHILELKKTIGQKGRDENKIENNIRYERKDSSN